MDFDSCFVDCCKSCNAATNKYRTPVSGQGDCKCSGEVRVQNFWTNEDKGKKLKSKTVREKETIEPKGDKRKKVTEMSCNCFAKNNKKPECKLKHEVEHLERNEPVIFENCSNAWNNFVTNSWKSKMERFYVSEERKYSDHSNSEKLLTENVLELEEKVDFLLRIFKVCSHKVSNDNHVESMKGTWGDPWQWFNLNKRLCAAEEGIEKLALILEELLKEWTKKKSFVLPDDCINYSEPFEEMTVGQRMNFLKNRNEILLSLIKTFLKSSSVEDVCSRLSSSQNEYEPKPVSVSSKLMYGGKNSPQEITREELMETLKNLQVSEPQPPKKNTHFNTRPPKREHVMSYSPNKLEVISEQAELALNQDDEVEELLENFPRLNVVRNLKGKFSQVSDNIEGSYDVTSRLLAQEAMLKSSLDKVHLELFSKLDSPEKNPMKASLNIINNTQMPVKKENNLNFETNFDSLSDISCIFCEDENYDKQTPGDTSHAKRKKHEDPSKEEKNSSGGKDTSAKRADESQIKTKRNVKTPHKTTRASSGVVQKPGQGNYCTATLCFSSREERNQNSQVQKARPLTAPVYRRKSLPPATQKVPTAEKSTRKHSGINSNVTNKNKILLSKKSFVQTP